MLLASVVFSEEPIKFKLITDSTGAPAPVVPVQAPAAPAQEPIKFNPVSQPAAPQKPDTVQKLGVASNRPLDLVALSAKDTASFETYSRRVKLVNDSIEATHRLVGALEAKTARDMPKLEPKGEFETTAEYEARVAKWNKELAEKRERDTKSYWLRLQELEKAKKKIEENQVSLLSSVTIKSHPAAASVWINREEIGATPIDDPYDLIPGSHKVIIRKEGYNPWDTTLLAVPGAKFKINANLEETDLHNCIYDFAKISKKDTTVEGYEYRIDLLEACKVQVAEDMKQILEDFANSYPALEPQRPDETPDVFNKRRDMWTREGMRQVNELQRKHKNYLDKLDCTAKVLKDYIIATQSTIISEPLLAPKIELGPYDADKQQFEFIAQDTASEKSPFYFKGRIGVPRDTAKLINKAAPGFLTNLQYINFPFKIDSANVNLAMSKLTLSRNGQDLKLDGSFFEIERYKPLPGYDAWKLHADSLLSGKLKAQGLALGCKLLPPPPPPPEDTTKIWPTVAKIATFSAAAIFGGLAVYKHLDAQEKNDDYNDRYNDPGYQEQSRKNRDGSLAGADKLNYDLETNKLKSLDKSIKDDESSRNIFAGVAGGLLAAGIVLTIAF